MTYENRRKHLNLRRFSCVLGDFYDRFLGFFSKVLENRLKIVYNIMYFYEYY